MTKEQKEKLEKYLDGIYYLSPNATLPYFSSHPCECCGSSLGGNRYDFIGKLGKKHNAEIIELSCCKDCFNYLFA